ncbi:MAG: T9SS type A sorting domain-containing protein [Bacteroidota bacterium]
MKKSIYISLVTLCLALLCENITAQCSWTTVGTGAASTATTTAYNDMALSSADVPYISYTDYGASSAVTVKTFSAGAWQAVGSLSTYTNASYTSIALDATIPYVAFADGTNGNRAIVKKYSAGTWTTVGAAITTSGATYLSLAMYNGTPYLLYVDQANGNKATVKTYTAGAWTALGPAVSTGSASYTSLAIDNSGTPYVIYEDLANSNLATVKKYSAGAWTAVGTGTVSTGLATETCIDVSYNNTPYIAYTGSSNIASIKTFTAGAWQSVGTGSISSAYMYLSIAVDPAGTPYLGYYELGNYKTSVMKYYGGSWNYAGVSGISIGTPSYHSLAITKAGMPYITYGDGSNGAYVKKFGGASAITQQPSSVSVCVGNGTTMSMATNTTGVNYQWQVSTGGVYANVVNGATYSGVTTPNLTFLNANAGLNGYQYRCVVYDGCSNLITNSATLTVNGVPALSVNNATVCSGAAATLTTSLSGLTYLWSTGATTSSIVVTPTINTNYTVTGTNTFGCSTVKVSTVTVHASKTISGNVTSSTGAVSGNMILYKYSPVLSKWDSVGFSPFSSIYSFGTVDSSWYVVKAIPTTTTNVLITYGSSAVSWKGATTITHGCTSNSSHNVTIIPLTSIGTGTGSLSGTIMEGQGFGQRPSSVYSPLAPGSPIGGIVVKGGKNPGGAMFAQTTTSSLGTYTLAGLPANAAGESYFILVDIPGLDTNNTYHKVITLSNNQYTGLDFVVDSAKINPIPSSATGIKTSNPINHEVWVFPNPAKNDIYIQYSLQANASVSIEMMDVLGNTVKTVLKDEQQLPQQHSIHMDSGDLKAGIYFMKIKINNSENTIKLFITN